MQKTLHLRGNFPLVLFVEESCIKLSRALRIVTETIGNNIYIMYVDQQPVYGFELYEHRLNLSGVKDIVIESSDTSVIFSGAVLHPDASLVVPGTNNKIEFRNCAITNLSINTMGMNVFNFEHQPILNSVNANLNRTLVTGLRVRGRTINKIDALNQSAVQISVGLAKECQRTFRFYKDDSSMIAVTCSKRGSREVIEDRELWSISDTLDSIVPICDSSYAVDMDCDPTNPHHHAACA